MLPKELIDLEIDFALKPSEKTYLGDAPSLSYHIEGQDAYIHFNNNDTSGYSPLSKERFATRKQELRIIVQDIIKNHHQVKFINGDSWLYNIEAYKRLFPQKFANTFEDLTKTFPYLPIKTRASLDVFLAAFPQT